MTFFIHATIDDRNASTIRDDAPKAYAVARKLIEDSSEWIVWIDAPNGERYHPDQFGVMLFTYATIPIFPQAVSVFDLKTADQSKQRRQ